MTDPYRTSYEFPSTLQSARAVYRVYIPCKDEVIGYYRWYWRAWLRAWWFASCHPWRAAYIQVQCKPPALAPYRGSNSLWMLVRRLFSYGAEDGGPG